MIAIEVSNLVKHYEARRVLEGLSFSVRAGEALLLLGENGAGKSTLLSILAGRLKPDAGTALICGLDAAGRDAKSRSFLGFVGHEPMLHPSLGLRENLAWYARMLGFAAADAAARTDALLQRLGLLRVAENRLTLLSRGEQQRAALCRALLANPQVLLLDEPFSGLDEPARRTLGEAIVELRNEGRAVLLTSHEIQQASACATHVALLTGGKLTGPVSSSEAASLLMQYQR